MMGLNKGLAISGMLSGVSNFETQKEKFEQPKQSISANIQSPFGLEPSTNFDSATLDFVSSEHENLYFNAETPLEKVEAGFALAMISHLKGDFASYEEWRLETISNACNLPGSHKVILPMLEGDFLALEKDHAGAINSYRHATEGIKAIEKSPEKTEIDVEAAKERIKGVISISLLSYISNPNLQKDPKVAKNAVKAAETLYLLEPTEEHLTGIMVMQSATGNDLSELHAKIQKQKSVTECDIYMEQAFYNQFLIKLLKSNKPQDDMLNDLELISGSNGLTLFDENSECLQAMSDIESAGLSESVSTAIAMHEFSLNFNQKEFKKHETHLVGLIDKVFNSNTESLQYNSHLGYLYMMIGKKDEAEKALLRSHYNYQKLPNEKRTDELRLNEITTLHRLFTLNENAINEQESFLKMAYKEITTLFEETDEAAIPVFLQHYQLEAALKDDKASKDLSFKRIEEWEFRIDSKAGYNKLIQYCKSVLNTKLTKNPALLTMVAEHLYDAQVTTWEKDFSYVLNLYLQEEGEDAENVAGKIQTETFTYFATDKYRKFLNPEQLNEFKSRFDIARAYYKIHSGKIKEAIGDLQDIVSKYPETPAAQAIHAPDFWPHKYNIVDGFGNWHPDLNQPSFWEATKKFVDKFLSQQGRALTACGIGAGLYIAGDLLLGEKITGGELLLACLAAYAVDRTFVIAENSSEISDAYQTGVSLISEKEAFANLGLFLFDLATLYAGGIVGRTAEQIAARTGLAIKKRMINWFVKRGALQAPWINKPLKAGFIIREGSIVANAYAFHDSAKLLQQAVRPNQPAPVLAGESDDNMFISWLFVRLLPVFRQWNPSSKVMQSATKMDKAMQFGTDMALGAATIQGIMGLTSNPDQGYADRTAETIIQLLVLHGGQRTIDYLGFKKLLPSLGVKTTPLEDFKAEKQHKADPKKWIKTKWKNHKEYKVGSVRAGKWLNQELRFHFWDMFKTTGSAVKRFFKSIAGKENFSKSEPTKISKEQVKTEIEKINKLYDELWAPPAKAGFFGRFMHGWKTYTKIAREINWELVKTGVEGLDNLYVEAAYKMVPPWLKAEFTLPELKAAVKRFKNGEGVENRPDGKVDTTIFKPEPNNGVNEAKPTPKKGLVKASDALMNVFDPIGKKINTLFSNAAKNNPRWYGTRNLMLALKELHREVVRSKMGEDAPQWFKTFFTAWRTPEKIAKAQKESAARKLRVKKAIYEGKKSELSGFKDGLSYFLNAWAYPASRLLHGLGLAYSIADYLFIDWNNEKPEEDILDCEIDSITGAIGFVMGSNLLAQKLGITTMGGGGIAEAVKTFTWGMLVSMEGSDPLAYFDKKPQDIVVLHLEYFAVLMGQVVLYQGMNAKPGNPIYKALTNLPVFRTMKSASRFYKYYTKRSLMQTPDLGTPAGRWISFLYAGAFHWGVARTTKDDSFLDAHGYLIWHRLAKVAHLGIWLKPLGVALNQASTKGQAIERLLGLGIDWLHGISTPIKVGKGTYHPHLKNTLSPEETQAEIDEAVETMNAMTEATHKVSRKCMTSLDFVGWVGNWIALDAGYGNINNWEPKAGDRIEIEAVQKHVEVMEKIVGDHAPAAVHDAATLDNLLYNHEDLGIDLTDKEEAKPMIVRAMEQKMWANQWADDKETKGPMEPYWHSIYGEDQDSNIKEFWKTIPTPGSHHELMQYVQELNDGTLNSDEIIAPLYKK